MFDLLFGTKKNTASIAKDRLRIIIAQERSLAGGRDYLPLLRQELLEVIRKYVSIDADAVKVDVVKEGEHDILDISVALPDERALSHGDTLALAALARAEAGETCNLPLGLKAVAGRAYLYLLTQRDEPLSPAPAARPLPVTVHESAYVLDFTHVTQTPAGPETPVPSHEGEAVLSPEMLALGPVMRRPRPD